MQLLINITKNNFKNMYYEIINFKNHYISYLIIKYHSVNQSKKIHLGCGEVKISGWLNTDIKKTTATDLILDYRRNFPFKDHSSNHIFAEHVFEHFIEEVLAHIFSECYRILDEGGKLDFSIPDFEKFSKYFFSDKKNRILKSYKKELRRWNIKFSNDFSYLNFFIHQRGDHKCFYTFEYIKYLLKNAGFKHVKKRKWIHGLDSSYRKDFSLYLSAIK